MIFLSSNLLRNNSGKKMKLFPIKLEILNIPQCQEAEFLLIKVLRKLTGRRKEKGGRAFSKAMSTTDLFFQNMESSHQRK